MGPAEKFVFGARHMPETEAWRGYFRRIDDDWSKGIERCSAGNFSSEAEALRYAQGILNSYLLENDFEHTVALERQALSMSFRDLADKIIGLEELRRSGTNRWPYYIFADMFEYRCTKLFNTMVTDRVVVGMDLERARRMVFQQVGCETDQWMDHARSGHLDRMLEMR